MFDPISVIHGDEHCIECGTKLTPANVRARIVQESTAEPWAATTPWEADPETAGVVELVCAMCKGE